MIQKNSCPNYNHVRINAPVRVCPVCGDMVNKDIPIKSATKRSTQKGGKIEANIV